MDVQAIIVNYATPNLTRRAVWSLSSLYPDLDIEIVDNGSPDDSGSLLADEFRNLNRIGVTRLAANLHHGPAMDRAVRDARRDWILLFDSDCIAYRSGFVEQMVEAAESPDAYMVGELCRVDDDGFNVNGDVGHDYIHPKCALVRPSLYKRLPPFERHGAPCLRNEIGAVAAGYELIDFPVDDYVFHLGRGTVVRHGYRLGLRSAASSFVRRAAGILGLRYR